MQVIGRVGGKHGQVFGAQWLLGVWQSRERRRGSMGLLKLLYSQIATWRSRKLSKQNCPVCKIPTIVSLPTCVSETSEHAQIPPAAAECSAVNNTSGVALRQRLLLQADNKLLSEHQRKYIEPFYLPFVVSVI